MITPLSGAPRKFIVIGAGKYVVLQVLLAIRAFSDAPCLAICPKGTRFLRRSILISEYQDAGFRGSDDDIVVDSIHRFAGPKNDAIVIPADCIGARLINRVCRRLEVAVIPAPNDAMLDCFDDKWRFFQFCKGHGLNTPSTRLVPDKYRLDYCAAVAELGHPFIVKPVNEQASIGTCVIAAEEEYRRNILENVDYRFSPLIAQRYIEGKDVGLNLLSINGAIKALSIQRRLDPTHDGSRIDFFAHDYLEKAAQTIAAASLYNGVMNIDARIEENTGDVYLFESNPRFWRSLSASVWHGMNFVEKCVTRCFENDVERLTDGSADTYYHPLFRPSLWRYALFDRGYRGKMARATASDICTLSMSTRVLSARLYRTVRNFVLAVARSAEAVRVSEGIVSATGQTNSESA